jgi:putative transcriptional regulator
MDKLDSKWQHVGDVVWRILDECGSKRSNTPSPDVPDQMTTIVSRRLADGSYVEVLPDGTVRPSVDKTDWAAVDALTDEEIMAAALADPDAQPLSDETLRKMRRGPHPRFLRLKLRLTREEFAERYCFPIDVLESWELQKTYPDEMIRAYLKAIAADPEGVARAVAAKPQGALAAE